VELRKKEEAHAQKTLACSADAAKFTSGASNVVVVLTFSDSIQWIARILLPREKEDENVAISLLSEM
jgi:hypothetical protein